MNVLERTRGFTAASHKEQRRGDATLTTLYLLNLVEGEFDRVDERWLSPMSRHLDAVAVWLKGRSVVGDRSSRFILSLVINTEAWDETTIASWVRAVKASALGEPGYALHVCCIAFLITLKVTSPDAAGLGELLVSSFEIVDRGLTRHRLTYWEWDALSQELPMLGLFEDWDRWKRLRIGGLRTCATFHYPFERFLEGISD
jgi:hypothetical protein